MLACPEGWVAGHGHEKKLLCRRTRRTYTDLWRPQWVGESQVGFQKADVVREVAWILHCISVPNADKGNKGMKTSEKFADVICVCCVKLTPSTTSDLFQLAITSHDKIEPASMTRFSSILTPKISHKGVISWQQVRLSRFFSDKYGAWPEPVSLSLGPMDTDGWVRTRLPFAFFRWLSRVSNIIQSTGFYSKQTLSKAIMSSTLDGHSLLHLLLMVLWPPFLDIKTGLVGSV